MSLYKRIRFALERRLPRGFGALDALAATINSRRIDHAQRPLVTIVVPLYNEPTYITSALKSIQRQSYRNFECLIVNDASTDASTAIARRVIADDPRFRIIDHEQNGGLSAARNTGLHHAKGSMICFLDADDLLIQHSLWRRVRALEAYGHRTDVGGSYCAHISVPEDGQHPHLRLAPIRRPDTPDRTFVSTMGDCPFPAHCPLLRTHVIRAFGGFDETMRTGCEDWELWQRMMRHGYQFVGSRCLGAVYRQKRGSMIRTLSAEHYRQGRDVVEWAYQPLPEAEVVPNTPIVFRQPVWKYAKLRTLAMRALPFATMAMHAGDEAGCSRILSSLPSGSFAELSHVLNIEAQIRVGTRRARHHFLPVPFHPTAEDRVVESRVLHLLMLQIARKGPAPRTSSSRPDVMFIPHNAYHAREMIQIATELERRGIETLFVDITGVYRDEGARDVLEAADVPRCAWFEKVLDVFTPSALFVMNDWGGVVKDTVESANERNITTLGLVEGVQDYDDTHVEHIGVGRIRHPYSRVHIPLLVGEYDRSFFDHDRAVVTGSPRIEDLANKPIDPCRPPESPLVVINSNFTYGVYTASRQDWLDSVAKACNAAGVPYVISRHHADQGDIGDHPVSDEPLYTLLERCSVLVSRFSGVLLEAMALGVPCIYHNPHGERVDTFQDPMGAYPITRTADELRTALKQVLASDADQLREQARPFFEHHVSLEPGRSSCTRIADEIERALNGKQTDVTVPASGELIAGRPPS